MFSDRVQAGHMLGEALRPIVPSGEGVIVLAIPRGGVLVAKEVADAIHAALDVIIARKIGAPGNPELAIGAVTQDGEVIADARLLEILKVPAGYMDEESARQVEEIWRRMKRFRGERPFPDLAGKTVVLVDDGIATGSTVRAAIQSIRRRGASAVILAVPVAPPDSVASLSQIADRVVCLRSPERFSSVAEFYADFEQVDDDTVEGILQEAWAKG